MSTSMLCRLNIIKVKTVLTIRSSHRIDLAACSKAQDGSEKKTAISEFSYRPCSSWPGHTSCTNRAPALNPMWTAIFSVVPLFWRWACSPGPGQSGDICLSRDWSSMSEEFSKSSPGRFSFGFSRSTLNCRLLTPFILTYPLYRLCLLGARSKHVS
jgi:hypothetical protein